MANVFFKFNKGSVKNLPDEKTEGHFYITTDEGSIYLDVDNSTRIRLGDFQEFDNVAALNENTNPSTTALYYIKDINCLAKWDGSRYIQINTDTGATSITVTGSGNAVTAASYDPETRKITLTKGTTFTTASDVDLKIADKIGNLGDGYSTVKEYVDAKTKGVVSDETMQELSGRVETLEGEVEGKVDSVTAGDASVKIGGTDTAPTVAVAIDNTSGNALKLVPEKGLRVEIPDADTYGLVKDSNSGEYAAVYHLTKNGNNIGTAINIPKDMVVESGRVVTDPQGQSKGTYIELTLANANSDKIYINVGDLIEYVTSGSKTGDMIVVAVSDDHKVTAAITDGTITLAKLASDVQAKIEQAHTHSNLTELNKIAAGDKAKWDAAEQNAKAYTDQKIEEALTWGSF